MGGVNRAPCIIEDPPQFLRNIEVTPVLIGFHTHLFSTETISTEVTTEISGGASAGVEVGGSSGVTEARQYGPTRRHPIGFYVEIRIAPPQPQPEPETRLPEVIHLPEIEISAPVTPQQRQIAMAVFPQGQSDPIIDPSTDQIEANLRANIPREAIQDIQSGAIRLLISGYASAEGEHENNINLSMQRSERLKNLVQNLLGSDTHITIQGLGEASIPPNLSMSVIAAFPDLRRCALLYMYWPPRSVDRRGGGNRPSD